MADYMKYRVEHLKPNRMIITEAFAHVLFSHGLAVTRWSWRLSPVTEYSLYLVLTLAQPTLASSSGLSQAWLPLGSRVAFYTLFCAVFVFRIKKCV